MIESLQSCLLLACLTALAAWRTRGAVVGGLLLAAALLTKVNSLFIIPVTAAWSAQEAWFSPREARLQLARCWFVFTFVGIAVAGGVYLALYTAYPGQFVHAFEFEITGRQFQRLSNPLFRIGRFGFDPEQGSRALLTLFRDNPVVMTAALFGVVGVAFQNKRLSIAAYWLIGGTLFILCQTFQPIRYYYLVYPAIVYYAATFIASLFSRRDDGRRIGAAVLVSVIIFDAAYFASSAVANRARMSRHVQSWAQTIDKEAVLVASPYLYVDLPQRAYAHYSFMRSPAQLDSALTALNAAYVIVDNDEWPRFLTQHLAKTYVAVEQWDFGRAFAVRALRKVESDSGRFGLTEEVRRPAPSNGGAANSSKREDATL